MSLKREARADRAQITTRWPDRVHERNPDIADIQKRKAKRSQGQLTIPEDTGGKPSHGGGIYDKSNERITDHQ